MSQVRGSVLSLFVLAALFLAAAPSAAANPAGDEVGTPNPECPVPNASGVAGGKPLKEKLSLETDAQSLNRTVNLGSDREEEIVTLRVNVPSGLKKTKVTKRMELVAEPFVRGNETGESVSFSDVTFSTLDVSGNGKRITFRMCIDPPNDLQAGKYVSTVMLDGPPGVESATMTVTVNGKNGGIFVWCAIAAAILSFLILLYKGAGERRTAAIAEAKKKSNPKERQEKLEEAERWRGHLGRCITDLGWLVPTLAAIVAAFALLWAAYDSNPAWGEGGPVTSALALIGTGLAAIGAKTIFTQSGTTNP